MDTDGHLSCGRLGLHHQMGILMKDKTHEMPYRVFSSPPYMVEGAGFFEFERTHEAQIGYIREDSFFVEEMYREIARLKSLGQGGAMGLFLMGAAFGGILGAGVTLIIQWIL